MGVSGEKPVRGRLYVSSGENVFFRGGFSGELLMSFRGCFNDKVMLYLMCTITVNDGHN